MHRAISLALLFAAFAGSLSAQTVTASVSGEVADATGGIVEGAAITATQIATGVVFKSVSNAQGVFLFASLPQGKFRFSAEKAGFQKFSYEDVLLQVSTRLTLNFKLEVGSTNTVIEVNAESENVLGYTTASIGGVISGSQILRLPNINRNALAFIALEAGTNGANFAGSRIGAQNITVDGINVQDNYINTGNFSNTRISPDRVEEVRVVTSPVDAEYGRGSGQVQFITPSGGNNFHGSLFEYHRNTIFNANPWFSNARGLNPRTGDLISPRQPLIRNQFGGKISGPIIKNKTFFFFLYDAQRERTRAAVTSTVYTQQARQGQFRFFNGARNGNADALVPTVDLSGNPVRPAGAGDLQSVNILGVDPIRNRPDPTGITTRLLGSLPLPNNFRFGDGLNTAGYTWNRSATADIDQYIGKVDHNFNSNHRLSVSVTKEERDFRNVFLGQAYPESPGGKLNVPALNYSFNLTSTISPTMTNEFRGGGQRAEVRFLAPWEVSGRDVLPKLGNEVFLPILAGVTDFIDTSNDPQGRTAPVYQFGDNITMVRGKHQFKAGVEVRFASANAFSSFNVIPRTTVGSGVVPNVSVQGIPGITANAGGAVNLLNDLTGTLAGANQTFNAAGASSPQYLPGLNQNRVWRQREWMMFFKDDFKVSRNLTLNLGVRWEYYGQPNERSGYMSGLVGGGNNIFGLSGNSYADMYQPGRLAGQLTRVELIGKGSPNAGTKIYNNDYNNFAPAVGFTYALPNWLGLFGERKTVIRSGYSIAFERNSFVNLDAFGNLPGLQSSNNFRSSSPLSLSNLRLPLSPIGAPLSTIPLTDRAQAMFSYDPKLRTPYIQNFNFSIQRELPKRMTLDVRYVGSKGTRLLRSTNTNEVNIFESGLLDAFRTAAAGGTSSFFERMFQGLNIAGLGRIDGVNITGSDAARALLASSFANQNIGALGSTLNTTALAGLPGDLLRRGGFPENLFVVSPQFISAIYLSNFANSTYHSMQTELKKRFSGGLTFQANWTWSRALGEEDGATQTQLASYRDGRNRSADRRLLGFHLTHVFRNNFTYELPFGKNKKFLGGSGSIVDRIVGGWEVNAIFNKFTGNPLNVLSTRSSLNQFPNSQTAYVTGPVDLNNGSVSRLGNGVTYLTGLSSVPDPSRAGLTNQFNLRSTSTLFAIQDAGGKILFQNPVAGQLGNLAPSSFYGPGAFRLDATVRKTIRITEGKDLILQADISDVTNTPQWGNPNLDINSANFGRITTATGNRLMIVGARFNF